MVLESVKLSLCDSVHLASRSVIVEPGLAKPISNSLWNREPNSAALGHRPASNSSAIKSNRSALQLILLVNQ